MQQQQQTTTATTKKKKQEKFTLSSQGTHNVSCMTGMNSVSHSQRIKEQFQIHSGRVVFQSPESSQGKKMVALQEHFESLLLNSAFTNSERPRSFLLSSLLTHKCYLFVSTGNNSVKN